MSDSFLYEIFSIRDYSNHRTTTRADFPDAMEVARKFAEQDVLPATIVAPGRMWVVWAVGEPEVFAH